MTAEELIAELTGLGVRLRVTGGSLAVQAPAGVLTPGLKAALAEHRNRLVALLDRQAGPAFVVAVPDPATRHDPFPLTDVQHGYWIGRNPDLELGGVATHFYFELNGRNLDVGRLEHALNRVIERHDMLRATVLPDGTQRVLDTVPPYRIRIVDGRGISIVELDAVIRAARADMAEQVMPADRWPLFEVRATRLTGANVLLHISLDLLMIDGFSMELLFADWRRYYLDPDLPATPPALSFRDYATAERAVREGPEGVRAQRYWLHRLATLPPAPELPLAVRPADLGRPRFTRRRFVLDELRWNALRAKARDCGMTPSCVLVTAFAEVLRMWARHPRFTLNVTTFSRMPLHPAVDEVIGDFTSVTLLEVDGDADTFTARAVRVQNQLLEDLGHQAFSGVRVLRELARQRGTGPGATMPVVFTSGLALDGNIGGEQARDFFGDFAHGISQTPQVWLDHQVMEERRQLVTNWDAVEDLFPQGVLDDMFATYRDLLERLAEDDLVWRRAGALVSLPAWQQQERQRVNDTARDLGTGTLHELVMTTASRLPHAVAVVAEDGWLTYGELSRHANRLARRLPSGRPIAVSMEKGWEQVVAVLGVLLAGAPYVPIDPDWPFERREHVLEVTGAEVVVTQERLRPSVPWPSGVAVVTCGDSGDDRPVALAGGPDDPAYVIFTSGSTGTPKGVVVSHRAARNTVLDLNERFGVGAFDRVLALSSLSFDLSVYDVFGTLAAGGAIVLPSPRPDPGHWSELIEREGVTVWNSVPALARAWLDGSSSGTTGVRLVLLSGDWIPLTLPDRLRERCPRARVIGLGGATEAAIWSVFHPIEEVRPEWTSIPYGKPLANQTLHICTPDLESRPVWTAGEVCIGGTGLADGYWHDPQRTAERFVTPPATGERLYRTGDLGRYLPGGDIEFLGREDGQIKINGFRVETGEIVARLLAVPSVRDAVVTAPPVGADPRAGRRLVAYVVGTVNPEAVRAELGRWLPDYMVPQAVVPLDRLPTTPNGKVDLLALPGPEPEPAVVVLPRTEVEKRLAAIWSEVLGVAEIGVSQDFVALGGDSVLAVAVLSRARAEFGLAAADAEELLRLLLANPVLADVAALVEGDS